MDDSGMEPRWLTDDEQGAWRAYLRGSRLLEAALDRDLQASGIQLSEYEILSMISEAEDNRLRMSSLADHVVQSRSRLTHTAARLEKRGWVRRESCLEDRRGVELVLTAAGAAAVQQMARLHVASVRAQLVDRLTPEQFVALGEAMKVVGDGITGGSTACEAVGHEGDQPAPVDPVLVPLDAP